MNDAETIAYVERMYLKTNEILSMMKKGEFITAYEKLGGVQKNLGALGGDLQRNLAAKEANVKESPLDGTKADS